MLKSISLFRGITILIAVTTITLILGACGSENDSAESNSAESNSETYTIEVALSLEETNPLMLSFPVFEELVEERSEGQIEVEYIGGPESIPPFNQPEAVQNGTIDMGWIAGSYYADIVPEVLGMSFSEIEVEEEIDRGALEYLSEIHEQKMNAKLLGRAGDGDLALHVSNEVDINSSEDLAGLDFRGTSVYVPSIEAVGGEAIALEAGEIYNSLERGLIDGYGWMNFSLPELGAQELTGYQIEPYIGKADQMILMNLDFWNELPEELQNIVQDASHEALLDAREQLDQILEDERAELSEIGVEFIELEDAEEFQELINESKWEWAAERVDDIDELKGYFEE